MAFSKNWAPVGLLACGWQVAQTRNHRSKAPGGGVNTNSCSRAFSFCAARSAEERPSQFLTQNLGKGRLAYGNL